MINKYKKLFNNSLIFAVANLGSKFINLMMVPLYTFTLTKAEYGVADLSMNIVNMVLPIASLSIYDAVLRYVMDKKQDQSKVLTNGFFILIISMVFLIITSILFSDRIYSYIIVIVVLQSFQSLFTQYIRAVEKLKLFAFNGIFLAIILLVLNVLFLKVFNKGIDGYFLSIILATLLSNIFLFFLVKIYKCISLKKIDKTVAKSMLLYSLPLIPNALMWWLINSANRYFILIEYGPSENGLFAVASKIPAIINIVYSIFFQAWQLAAIEEFEKKEDDKFYSQVFTFFSSIMFISASMILVILIPLMGKIISASFFDSWKYVPFLLLSVIFSSFAGFLGTNYIALKNTKGIFTSSLIAGILNLILSFILLKLFSPIFIGLASTCSFFVMFMIRYFETRESVNIHVDFYKLFLSVGIILIQTLLLLTMKSSSTVYNVILTCLHLFVYKDEYIVIFKLFKRWKVKNKGE